MLSNKWTFSLTSLVVILVLALVAPSAMAGEFAITLSPRTAADNASDPDVSYADGIQVQTGAAIAIGIKTDKVVQLHSGTASADHAAAIAASTIENLDFMVIAYNEFGGTVGTPTPGTLTAVDPANGQNFTMTLGAPAATVTRVLVLIPKNAVELADPRAELDDDGKRKADGKSAATSLEIHYVGAEPSSEDAQDPRVISIERVGDALLPVTAATFDVLITLSEEPRKDGFKKDHIDVSNATAADPVALDTVDVDVNDNGIVDGNDGDMAWTGRDGMHHRYVVTITPKYENKNDIVVKVKMFYDQERNPQRSYPPPALESGYVEGMDKLTVKVGKEVLKAGTAGLEVILAKELFIPSGGYLVVADDEAGSAIINPGGAKDAPPVTRPPAAQKYNLNAKALPNLETFLANGGVIDVVSPMSLTISEIMWGSDASIKADNSKSQWIELRNSGDGANTLDDDAATAADEATRLIFYGYGQAPAATLNADGTTTLPAGVKDRVGTIDAKGAVWSLAGKGQSGRTGAGEKAADLTAIIPTQPLISMYRMMDATGNQAADGTMASSWMASSPPAVNFKLDAVGVRIASPGAAPIVTTAAAAAAAAAAKAKADAAAAAAAKAADTSVSVPKVGQIYISEVMFAGGGTLPQWIEISNGSRSEQVNLSDWTLTVENATADADVSVGAKAVFTIPEGTKIDPSGQNDTPSTILVVTEQGRNNVDGSGQILNLWTDQQTELILLGVTKRRYSLLSDMAFQITLAPPVPIVAPAAATTRSDNGSRNRSRESRCSCEKSR